MIIELKDSYSWYSTTINTDLHTRMESERGREIHKRNIDGCVMSMASKLKCYVSEWIDLPSNKVRVTSIHVSGDRLTFSGDCDTRFFCWSVVYTKIV